MFHLNSLLRVSLPSFFLSRQTTDSDSLLRRCGVTEEKNVGHVHRQQQWKTVAKVGHIDREARLGKWADLLIAGWQLLTLCLYLPLTLRLCLQGLSPQRSIWTLTEHLVEGFRPDIFHQTQRARFDVDASLLLGAKLCKMRRSVETLYFWQNILKSVQLK